jgi:hypothetical protein
MKAWKCCAISSADLEVRWGSTPMSLAGTITVGNPLTLVCNLTAM